ncbi:BMP family ABC transporter substrate-binding protein [Celeribacter ethanolicus]|uniref:BMP family ABC transporter substrate-binding protein n=1 Tax=Celeribacter ethanolicus TaxID=1758178 RepID=UPI000A7F221C|nr:BMP family ABC transporter substrate-binding protein [Celeribacter ethanolicus]
MAQYLNGIVAGHMTKSKKLGFAAAKPIPQVLLNINSLTLGARAVDPEIEVQVIFTGEWSALVKEAEATNALVSSGADVITCHVDGAKVVIGTTEQIGGYSCGYHTTQQEIAPHGYLTGAEWNGAPVYETFVSEKLAGQPLGHFVRGGLGEHFVKSSPYGPAFTEAAKSQADAVRAEMMKGNFAIINGPLKDNTGKEVVPAGLSYPETAIELEAMDYLVEGVIDRLCKCRRYDRRQSHRGDPVQTCRIFPVGTDQANRRVAPDPAGGHCRGAFGTMFSLENKLQRASGRRFWRICLT